MYFVKLQIIIFLLLYHSNICLVMPCQISCICNTVHCIQGRDDCYLPCSKRNNNEKYVQLTDSIKCGDPSSHKLLNQTDSLLKINTTTSGIFQYKCCQDERFVCANKVIIYDNPQPAENLTCVFEVNEDHVNSTCYVEQRGYFNNISVDISKMPNREDDKLICNSTGDKIFTCPRIKLEFIDLVHTFMVTTHDNYHGKENVTRLFTLKPVNYIKHSRLNVEVFNMEPTSVDLKLTRPYYDYMDKCNDENAPCSWSLHISLTNQTIRDTRSPLTHKLTKLHPDKSYTAKVKWKLDSDVFWSHESIVNFNTSIGVPETAPHVVNIAKGDNYVAIYIQKRPVDSYFGPIHLRCWKSGDKRIRRNLISQKINISSTIFVQSEETDEIITLRFATDSGVSSNVTTISLHNNGRNQFKLYKRSNYNKTHDQLEVDDISSVDTLHVYWCFGKFLSENQLVDCETSIQSEKKKPSKKIIMLKPTRPESLTTTCPDCVLYYAAALNNDSMVWETEREEISVQEDLILLSILIPVIVVGLLAFCAVCILRCCKSEKRFADNSKVKVPAEITEVSHTLLGSSSSNSGNTSPSIEMTPSDVTTDESCSYNSSTENMSGPIICVDTSNQSHYPINIHTS